MTQKIQSVRGMYDVLPDESAQWHKLEAQLFRLMQQYGYQEVRFPHVEQTQLFKRSIGDVTDIVEKEMYTFDDRNGDSLSLRPEGTASCLRLGLQHGLLHNQTQRLWYSGSMFRHERPQKGRYREFRQLGVEAYGFAGADIEAEMILMLQRLWQNLGFAVTHSATVDSTDDDSGKVNVRLEINTLGTLSEREDYLTALSAYLQQHHDQLDADSQRRLTTNPLRILDSKNPQTQELLTEAPVLSDYLQPASRTHFEQIKTLLDQHEVAYHVNPRLVRGLDYYSHTVFEWVTDQLGAQGTICAGGRYDRLVEQLSGKPGHAMGYAMGLERILTLLQVQDSVTTTNPDIYILSVLDDAMTAQQQNLQLAERLRSASPDLSIITHCGGGSFKSQLKKADRSQADWALIQGQAEYDQDQWTVKALRGQAEQVTIPQANLYDWLETIG